MLVKLTSSASGEIIMFAKDAHQLFEIIGKERTARGVFTKEQLPEARAKLQHAVDEEKSALREAERKAREGGVVDEHETENDEDHKSGRVGKMCIRDRSITRPIRELDPCAPPVYS